VGFVLFLRILTQLGDVAMAANSITVRIESLSFLPGLGFGVATSTLAGQCLGAGDAKLAERSMKRAMVYAALLMSLVGLSLAIFPQAYASLFEAEKPVRDLVVACLMIAAIEQVPMAIFFSLGGGLRGAGDTMSAMMVTIFGMVFVRLPVAYALGLWAGWGLVGLWVSEVLDWTVRAVFVYNRMKRGSWRKRAAKPVETPPIVPELEGRYIDEV
jgi:Na+-driven multidrug efflux pump